MTVKIEYVSDLGLNVWRLWASTGFVVFAHDFYFPDTLNSLISDSVLVGLDSILPDYENIEEKLDMAFEWLPVHTVCNIKYSEIENVTEFLSQYERWKNGGKIKTELILGVTE